MEYSDLGGLHARGLLACTALQHLDIWDCCSINAADPADSFQCCRDANDIEDDHWPADMSSLACLTDLCVRLREGSDGVDLTGVATLTSLTSLEFVVNGPTIVGPVMESLHKLICLDLASCTSARFNPDSDFDFSCDWHGYHVLQQLRTDGLFKADSKLLGLVKLPHLRNVNMRKAKPVDHASAFFLGSLSKHMALKCRPRTSTLNCEVLTLNLPNWRSQVKPASTLYCKLHVHTWMQSHLDLKVLGKVFLRIYPCTWHLLLACYLSASVKQEFKLLAPTQ